MKMIAVFCIAAAAFTTGCVDTGKMSLHSNIQKEELECVSGHEAGCIELSTDCPDYRQVRNRQEERLRRQLRMRSGFESMRRKPVTR